MTTSGTSIDTVFELLANRRRRYALYYLDQHSDSVVTLDELAEQVVDWGRTWDDADELSPEELRKRTRTALHHKHLPRLAEEGLLDYDPRTQTVRNWDDPSLAEWASGSLDEVPHLRSLFCTTAIR